MTATTPTELPDSMRASILHPDLSITTDEVPVPDLDADEVLVQVGAVGVCGSDVHYWKHGRIADFVVDDDIILGHELGGRIVAVGAGIDEARIGQRVAVEPQRSCRVCEYCKSGRYNLCPKMGFYATPPIDGGFCEYVTIQADYAHPIPDEVSDAAAAMLEPLSVGIAAARKADLRPGQSVFIAGAGPIGIIQCQVARAFGAARIIVSDPAQPRRELALQHGATDVVDPTATDVSTAGYNVDAFIDCAGVAPAVVSGMHTVKPGGHVVLVGMGADEIALPIPLIQNYELVVTGIFRYTDTYPLGIHFVASGKVDLDALVTSSYGLDEAQTALGRAGAPDELKVVVRPRE